jgi:acyl-CoA thioesterase
MSIEFSEVLASLRPRAESTLEVTAPPEWLQGRTVFGGMQMALAARAMRVALPAEARTLALRSAQVTFVGPIPGSVPIALRAETLRNGRSTAHARCDLLVDGAVACSVVGIFGTSRTSHFVHELSPPRDVPAASDVPEKNWTQGPAFLQHFDMRIARGDLPFSGYAEPRSSIYVRLRDRSCAAEDALLALADSIPTPVLSMLRAPARNSSLNWMIEILRDPAQLDLHDWVLLDTEVRAGTDGYLSQTSLLYGADGHAYAVSHQTVAVFG